MELTKEQKFYAEIMQKAWDDADFKKELIENPVEAIEKLTGTKLNLPTGKKLVVRDQSNESTVYLNIPQGVEEVELSEDQLENVAGGVMLPSPILIPGFPIWPPIILPPMDSIYTISEK